MLKTLLISMLLMAATGIYDFKLKTLDGKPMDMAQFKGKKMLIVNTASKCGYTKQYADLQELYEKYGSKVTVVGFPANNFGGQEPGSNEEIASFCKKNFGVSFPMAEKVSVKGSDIHPLFKYLTEEAGKMGVKEPIKWNFTKFLIDENGKLLAVFPSGVKPTDEAITKYLN
ncbi:glutathione peroxidase [Flavihumibacter cheonanensis]|jgi:glutathione peroxidase|uniref:glutathione peroxidase n=1 Tax=Flavihumibacter cheonanensis TaxID=1442385 RepID=UPI001EF778B5|nr:glutathione peroxidase [Flavihumibacter cheonanensis]MCG7753378.1 glutathione peroxidase [Flavihumibacter cheonanensis]